MGRGKTILNFTLVTHPQKKVLDTPLQSLEQLFDYIVVRFIYHKRRSAKKSAARLAVGIEVRKSRMRNRRVCPRRRAAAQPSAAPAVGRSVGRLPFNGFHRFVARAPGARTRWGLTEI